MLLTKTARPTSSRWSVAQEGHPLHCRPQQVGAGRERREKHHLILSPLLFFKVYCIQVPLEGHHGTLFSATASNSQTSTSQNMERVPRSARHEAKHWDIKMNQTVPETQRPLVSVGRHWVCEHHDTAQPTSCRGTRHELWKHGLLRLLLCLGTRKGCTQEATCTLGVGKFARHRKSMTEGRNSICKDTGE